MQATILAKRLVDNWPVGAAVAIFLAMLPFVNWLGLALAVVLVLRHAGGLSSFSYVLVALANYFAISGYSLALFESDWLGILVIYFPLWAMATVLRVFRSLSLALTGGAVSLMGLILVNWLIHGTPTLEAWVNYFQLRMQATGLTEAQLTQMLPNAGLAEVSELIMYAWPLSVALLQTGLLMFARWLQARCYYPGGFRIDFQSLRQPKAVALVCGLLLLATSFSTGNMVILINLGLVALVLMGVSGLGFVHAYVNAKNFSPWWLSLVYLFMVFNTWATLMLLSMVALADSGLNLRMRVR